MKQVLMKKGVVFTAEIPSPRVEPGMVLVRLQASCISPGTEMMRIVHAEKTLLQRAMQQPEKVVASIAQMRKKGVGTVLRRVQEKQAASRPMGYSAAGVAMAVGEGVVDIQPGDRVAVAGNDCAFHAEEVLVPVNLTVRIPDEVRFEDAAPVALGAIAMQGVRRAEVRLGEFVSVIGCGSIGQIAIQMLKAAGCRVVAVDLDKKRLDEAAGMGADLTVDAGTPDAVRQIISYSHGFGVDAVIITAATDSNEPLLQAFQMARRKGRVVLLGVVGKEFSREVMYAKELDFTISMSYGPGRYDASYEQHGLDYPYEYVRWTERRNMESFLHLVATRQVNVEKMIGGCFPVEQADAAFDALRSADRPLLAIIEYATERSRPDKCAASDSNKDDLLQASHDEPSFTPQVVPWRRPEKGIVGVAIVGAGGFISATHLPNLQSLGDCYAVKRVIDRNGVAAEQAAQKFPNCKASTDIEDALNDSDVHMVLIGTRHNTHAELAVRAMRAGKAVFVEKPMCVNPNEFEILQKTWAETETPFVVGYNRRFSPHAHAVRSLVEKRVNPLIVHYTMNAGYIPYTHWTQTDEGGGRIIGEGCHILDLFRYLVGRPVESVSVDALHPTTGHVRPSDNRVITVRYKDGSVCTLLYTSIGNSDCIKERMEVFFDEKMVVLEDYQNLTGYGCSPAVGSLKGMDKGHRQELKAFHEAIMRGDRSSIPLEEMAETWQLSWQSSRNDT